MDGNKFLFDRIAEAIQATGQSGEYSRGMCNGMLFVKSLIDGKEPEYFQKAGAGEPEDLSVENSRSTLLKFRPGLTVAEYPGALEQAHYPTPRTYFVEVADGGRYVFPGATLTFTRHGDGRETYELYDSADELLLHIDAANVKRIARADKTDVKERTSAEVLADGQTIRSLDYCIARLQEIIFDTMGGKDMGAPPEMFINPRMKIDGGFEVMFHGLNLSVTLAYLRAFRNMLHGDAET